MPIDIRKARIEDAPSLASLLRSLDWFSHIDSEPAEATASRVSIRLAQDLADSSHTVYIAMEASEITGYCCVHWLPYLFLPGPEGYISELFLRPSVRGQGTGTRLVEAVIAEARSRGCYRLSLLNNRSRESYHRRYYPKHGWAERGEMANFVYLL